MSISRVRPREYFWRAVPTQCLRCALMQTSSIRNICDPCYREIPRITFCCKVCGIPTPKPVEICGQCLKKPRYIRQSFIPCPYLNPVDSWLRNLKENRGFNALPVLSQLLLQRVPEDLGDQIDLIIPVPIHWRKRLRRGYNQTELLAKALALKFNIPLCDGLLKRTRPVRSQRGLNRKQRLRNQRNSFGIKGGKLELTTDKRILVVDDILTTGATVAELAKFLRSLGAESVSVAAIARTLEDSSW